MPQTDELLWSIVLITVIGVGAFLILFVARAYRRRLKREAPTEAFTLQELREMLQAGSITQQEYQAMRAAVIGRAVAESPDSSTRSGRDSEGAGGPRATASNPGPDD